MGRGRQNRFREEESNAPSISYTTTISGRLIDTLTNQPIKGVVYVINEKNEFLHKFDTDDSGNFNQTVLLNGKLNPTDPQYTNLRIAFTSTFYISYTRYIFYYNPNDYPGYSTEELNNISLGDILMYLTANDSTTTINITGPGGISVDAKIDLTGIKRAPDLSDANNTNITTENLIEQNDIFNESNTIKIEAENYAVTEVDPYEKGGTVRQDLDIIKLDDGIINIDDELLKIQYPDIHIPYLDQYKALKKLTETSRGLENKKEIVREAVKQNLKRKMLPLIIKNMLLPFGITTILPLIENKVVSMIQLSKKDNFGCPSNEEIQRIIKRKNRVSKALNIIYVSLNAASAAVGINQGLLQLIKPSIKLNTFAPSTFYGGPVPQPDIPTKVAVEKTDELEKESAKIEKRNKNLLIFLTSVTFLLGIIIKLLNATDQALQECTDEDIEPTISEELQNFNQEFDKELNNKINGFILEIETEKTENSLKRKRAIAKNDEGVILLRGEYSFASSDEILIDELKFYIQQNDLKAE